MELRLRRAGGQAVRQRFHPTSRPRAVARTILALGRDSDVWVGVAPRRQRHGGRAAIARVWALWADCDGAAAAAAAEAFQPAPAILVRSGSGANLHAYWLLAEPLAPELAERANRRLAHALGSDPASTDAARILRPPGTRNHKHQPPAAVRLERLQPGRLVAARDVVGHLVDPPDRRPTPAPARPRTPGSDPLRDIAPAVYIRALTGQVPDRTGKVSCPLHEDRTPSLHVYDSPEAGWFCYSCRAGGSVFDLAAALWLLDLRGPGFIELRGRLEDLFGVTQP